MSGSIISANVIAAASVDEPLREVLASADGVRVQLVTLSDGTSIPWHHHSVVHDTIIPVVGSVLVETRPPTATRRLIPGQRMTIQPRQAHRVRSADSSPCQFLNLHVGGDYDFEEL